MAVQAKHKKKPLNIAAQGLFSPVQTKERADGTEFRKDATEEWRPVVGYEGLYEVSRSGGIRSLYSQCRKRGHRLKGAITERGYVKASLYKDGRRKELLAHQVVAQAFIGPRPTGYEVNHKDAQKQNNAAANLEYVTHKENIGHARAMGLMNQGELHGRAVLSESQVRNILTSAPYVRIGTLADYFGVGWTAIYLIVKRRNWAHVVVDEPRP